MGTFDIQNMQKLLSIRQSSLTLSINPLCSNKCQFLTIFPNRIYVQCCSDFFFICNISDRRFLIQQSNRKGCVGHRRHVLCPPQLMGIPSLCSTLVVRGCTVVPKFTGRTLWNVQVICIPTAWSLFTELRDQAPIQMTVPAFYMRQSPCKVPNNFLCYMLSLHQV